MKIAIVGGGIGRLTTALTLTQAVFAVVVYELSGGTGRSGLGDYACTQRDAALYQLGLEPDLEATSVTRR